MNTKGEKIDSTTVCLRIDIPSHEIVTKFNEALEKANLLFEGKTAKKNGLESQLIQFKDYVKRDVCNQVVKLNFPLALKKVNLFPVSTYDWSRSIDFRK